MKIKDIGFHAKEHPCPKAHQLKFLYSIYETSNSSSLNQSEPKKGFLNQIQIDLGQYLKTRIWMRIFRVKF